MEMFTLIAVTIYCLVSLAVGARMLLLAKRTHELPELTIGLAFVSGGMLGYPCSIAAGVLAAASKDAAAEVAHVLGQVGMALAAFFMLVAWRFIFAQSSKAGLVVLAWGAFVLVSVFAVIRITEPGSNAQFLSTTFRMVMVAQGGCYVMLGWASYRHSLLLKKRCAIGLADPVIADRMFVWSLANASVVVSYVYTLAAGFLIQSGLDDFYYPVVPAFLGLISAVCVWLSFFPPQAYLDRIRAASAELDRSSARRDADAAARASRDSSECVVVQ
jgi:hypothetical protein